MLGVLLNEQRIYVIEKILPFLLNLYRICFYFSFPIFTLNFLHLIYIYIFEQEFKLYKKRSNEYYFQKFRNHKFILYIKFTISSSSFK